MSYEITKTVLMSAKTLEKGAGLVLILSQSGFASTCKPTFEVAEVSKILMLNLKSFHFRRRVLLVISLELKKSEFTTIKPKQYNFE